MFILYISLTTKMIQPGMTLKINCCAHFKKVNSTFSLYKTTNQSGTRHKIILSHLLKIQTDFTACTTLQQILTSGPCQMKSCFVTITTRYHGKHRCQHVFFFDNVDISVYKTRRNKHHLEQYSVVLL